MKKILSCQSLLLPTALLAGWLGAGRYPGVKAPDLAGDAGPSPQMKPPARERARISGGLSSAGLAALAAEISWATAAEKEQWRQRLADWPDGTARSLVQALLQPAAGSGDTARTWLAEETAKELAHPADSATLEVWLHLDPGAAAAAVRQMPWSYERTAAANKVAAALCRRDAARGFDFIISCGERTIEPGVAKFWLELKLRDAAAADGIIDRLTADQRISLTNALGAWLTGRRMEAGVLSRLSAQEAVTLLRAGDLTRAGPAAQAALLSVLGDYCQEEIAALAAGEAAVPAAVRHMAVAARAETLVRDDPDAAIRFLQDTAAQGEAGLQSLSAAAPRILPMLCRRGRLVEAAGLLDQVEDQEAWRTAFQQMLPFWMDADPSSARATFATAPLTALEREAWERHPAFLLNP